MLCIPPDGFPQSLSDADAGPKAKELFGLGDIRRKANDLTGPVPFDDHTAVAAQEPHDTLRDIRKEHAPARRDVEYIVLRTLELLQALNETGHRVVNVGEVQHLVSAVYDQIAVLFRQPDEERDDPIRVVVHPVYVGEACDDKIDAVTSMISMDQCLSTQFGCGIGTLAGAEVDLILVPTSPDRIPVHFPAGREEDSSDAAAAAVLQHVIQAPNVLQSQVRIQDEIVDPCVGCQMRQVSSFNRGYHSLALRSTAWTSISPPDSNISHKRVPMVPLLPVTSTLVTLTSREWTIPGVLPHEKMHHLCLDFLIVLFRVDGPEACLAVVSRADAFCRREAG
jgi:hypothetical protein